MHFSKSDLTKYVTEHNCCIYVLHFLCLLSYENISAVLQGKQLLKVSPKCLDISRMGAHLESSKVK